MRVGIVASFYPDVLGGAEVGLGGVVRALLRDGAAVTVFTLGDGSAAHGERLVPLRVLPRRVRRRVTLLGPPGFDRVATARLGRALAADLPGVLHAWDSYATPAAARVAGRAGIPLVASYHNNVGVPHRAFGALPVAAQLLDRREQRILSAASRATAVVGISEYVAGALVAAGLDERRVRAIHLDGIVDAIETRTPPPAGRLEVLATGRLQEHKGFETAIRALALLRRRGVDARLTIVGWGPREDALRRLAAAEGCAADVVFAGRRAPADMPGVFDAASLVVVPSLTPEPFGRVAVEAFARGRPVVASDVGGLSEIVRHGETGFLVPPGDPDTLAGALETFAQQWSSVAELGERALADARSRFSERVILDALVTTYRQAAEG
jgi:glycosyltransferase involved in cell wall biosynthesis